MTRKSPLMSLMEEYVDRRPPSLFDRLPVSARARETPIIATDKWSRVGDALTRTFRFETNEVRNEFVKDILDHEAEVGHHTQLIVREGAVEATLTTNGVGVTELDQEFAKWMVTAYKDAVYGRTRGDHGLL